MPTAGAMRRNMPASKPRDHSLGSYVEIKIAHEPPIPDTQAYCEGLESGTSSPVLTDVECHPPVERATSAMGLQRIGVFGVRKST